MIRQRLKPLLPPGGCSSGALGVTHQSQSSNSMFIASINDPTHWLDRAKEGRALAAQIGDPEGKRMILKVAADYERLAH